MPDARDDVRRIADAVLYEGYVLWPYRRSALKNQRRWTFGGVYPRGHSERHPDDRSVMRTECLVEGEATLDVAVRFLQVVRRGVGRDAGDGLLEPVDELLVGVRRHLAWDEAVEREVSVGGLPVGDLCERLSRVPVAIPAGGEEEELLDGGGTRAGAIVRTWEALDGSVAVSAVCLAPGLHRVTVEIENVTPCPAEVEREAALARTFCSTHTVLRVAGGAFVSLTDPPAPLREAAGACRNEGTWPVLVGAEGSRDTLLSSPIILEDHPRIAPESPGDLFDGGEIDQLLILNILSLTDEEKDEMRATDPRTREILERTEALEPEQLMRLHGAIRDLRPAG